MSELEPTPELPDDTAIREVRFPTRINDALFAAGLKTVGEVREMSDDALLSLPGFGKASIAHLRETLGLPSTDGVRPTGKSRPNSEETKHGTSTTATFALAQLASVLASRSTAINGVGAAVSILVSAGPA